MKIHCSSVLSLLILTSALLTIGLVGPGCAGKSPQTIAGQSLMATALTVDKSLASFAVFVKLKEGTATPVTQATIDRVETMRSKYAAAMEVARTAWLASANTGTVPGTTPLATALAALDGCKAELLAFITSTTATK